MELQYMEPVYIAFLLFLLITAYNYLKPKESRNYTSINTDEARRMLENDQNIMLIDVRNENEYNSEHLKNAKNIPLNQLEKRIKKLPRDKDIIIYCQTGSRSIRAIRKLEVNGFNRLSHMHEGLRGWKINGYPTRKYQKRNDERERN
jgi:rhodanese-related sulfurtransferase